jgi:hypothetical protein
MPMPEDIEIFKVVPNLHLCDHHVRQAPDSKAIFAVLKVSCIDFFRPLGFGVVVEGTVSPGFQRNRDVKINDLGVEF